MATCLVTGGAGFLGSFLCERLLAAGANVICVDNSSAAPVAMSNICSVKSVSN